MSDQIEDLKPEDVSAGDRPLSIPSELPILPLRDTVLFPNSFMPLAVARESSVRLIDDAIANGKLVAAFTQRDASVEDPGQDDLYGVGIYNHSTYNTVQGNCIGIDCHGMSLPNTKNPSGELDRKVIDAGIAAALAAETE